MNTRRPEEWEGQGQVTALSQVGPCAWLGRGEGCQQVQRKAPCWASSTQGKEQVSGGEGVGLRHKLEVRPHFANEEGTYVSFEYVERKRPQRKRVRIFGRKLARGV